MDKPCFVWFFVKQKDLIDAHTAQKLVLVIISMYWAKECREVSAALCLLTNSSFEPWRVNHSQQHQKQKWKFSWQCSNFEVITAFLYQIIRRRPSSSGSLPPGCRRWVSQQWGHNGGRCRCLQASQAEQSAQREETKRKAHMLIRHQQAIFF